MKATKVLTFRVYGIAQSRGSKKAITVPGLRRGLLIDDNPKSGPWMAVVRQAGEDAMKHIGRTELFDGPLSMRVTIFRKRPKSHFTAKGNLKLSAPAFPATKPDSSKCMRAIEDALTKSVYVDDSRLVDSWPSKRWGEPGVLIELFKLPKTMADLVYAK